MFSPKGPKFTDPVFVRLSKKYKKTPAQIVLRWLIDRDVIPVPKTVSVKRLIENIDVFDFKLTEDEIEEISAFDTNTRYTLPSFWQNHPYYPFEKIDNPIANPFGV
ncbi:aldo/keto reductase family domain-containing protein [Phthorimaea operculella]|nr:aldo/keto reductase family domain-containing protein [Phthorimaea operculella]